MRKLVLAALQEQCRSEFTSSWAKWRIDSVKWRSELEVSKDACPYSANLDAQAAGFASQPTKRVADLMDMTVLHVQKKRRLSSAASKVALREVLLDISQSHSRRPFSGPDGISRCLTTSSRLFFFGQQRLVAAMEHFRLQGYDNSLSAPTGVSDSDLRRMAGEGIALPCLGVIVWAIRLTAQF